VLHNTSVRSGHGRFHTIADLQLGARQYDSLEPQRPRTTITLSSGMPKQAKHSRAGWNQRGVNGRP
jgi:hypothetical protein